MKNILVHINPKGKFDSETELMARLQIDNSLELGWHPDDIYLFTNFDYNYSTIRAYRVPGELYCPFRPLSSKTITIAFLLEQGFFDKIHAYWIHDFDAFQNVPFDLQMKDSVAMTDYGWGKKWSMGSYFVRESDSSKDLFHKLKEAIYEYQLEDERALRKLTEENKVTGYEKLNITYNFGMRRIGQTYPMADKPIKVVHFHPWRRGRHVLESFMYGKNEVGVPLMSERLIKLFNQHGIR